MLVITAGDAVVVECIPLLLLTAMLDDVLELCVVETPYGMIALDVATLLLLLLPLEIPLDIDELLELAIELCVEELVVVNVVVVVVSIAA